MTDVAADVPALTAVPPGPEPEAPAVNGVSPMRAAIAEAVDPETHISVEFRGETYIFERAARSDVEFLIATDEGHWYQAMKILLGRKELARWINANRRANGRADDEDFGEFTTAVSEALNVPN